MSREWNGWSGRGDVKCIAEGGVRVKLLNGKCSELEYRTTSNDMIRWWVEDGQVFKEIGGTREQVFEIWFEKGIPIEDPPAIPLSRTASKRLTELALRNKIFRELFDDDYYSSGIERGRRSCSRGRRRSYSRTPPPPLISQNRPATGRKSPTQWDRPWRERSTSPSNYKTNRLGYRSQQQFRKPSPRGLLRSPRRSASPPLNPHLVDRTLPPAPPNPIWSTPFCPHCGQPSSTSATPFCPQTGVRHLINK